MSLGQRSAIGPRRLPAAGGLVSLGEAALGASGVGLRSLFLVNAESEERRANSDLNPLCTCLMWLVSCLPQAG
ncbi:MAG: hypothetical protein Q8N36_00280, partial [bacterium]|nr:hypothetical protein [bacterium]